MKRPPAALAIGLLCFLCLPALSVSAQPAPGSSRSAEQNTQAKITQLEVAKARLARQAREATGYHESLRQMKIVKIDDLIARLKNGENVPQSKIDKVIGHMSFPLYKGPHD